MKVSFDFDDTLDMPIMQEYAKELINKGIDVHIVTTRYEDVTNYSEYFAYPKTYKHQHRELFRVASLLTIPEENIHFTNMDWKYTYFKDNSDFIWHLDDNPKECDLLDRHTSIIGICHDDSTWKMKCEKLLENV